MKKALITLILISIILIFYKYCFSNYELNYDINGYKVYEQYNDKRFYYEIEKDNYKYNFDVYQKRSLGRTVISKIKEITGEDFNCIYPVIEGTKTYPLCYQNNEYIRFDLIETDLLDEYKETIINVDKNKKDFVYYNNLSNNEYVALWNYRGYIIMNGNSYNNVNIFEKDKYDNTSSYMIDNIIYIPNYDEEHEYTKLVKLNVETLKYELLDLGVKIDNDSYIVGYIKKNLYIFDNKYSILYEINMKNGKTKILANNEKGFVKYKNGEFVSCSKSEYKNNKIKYNKEEQTNYTYEINNGLFKTIKDNKNIKERILNNDVYITKEHQNKIYYLDNDNYYSYSPVDGKKLLFYNYELQFNKENTIFVYIK